MPRAAQETLRSGVPLLEYKEFFDLNRKQYGLDPILGADQIPVHPKVFEAQELYTPEFADEVWESVPESIKADAKALESVTGVPVPVKVSDSDICWVNREGQDRDITLFSSFGIEANTNQRQVWLRPSGDYIDLGLDSRNHLIRSRRLYTGPLSKSKFKIYALPETENSEGGLITWYTHNRKLIKFPTQLIFRNFAIQFNNLGLQKLGLV